jgi:glycosyltransferase involved in cell wall biosynthesis
MSAPESSPGIDITIPVISISWHGGTRVLVELANCLANRGHRVRFLVCRGRFSSPYRLDGKVLVQQVGLHSPFKYLDYALFLARLPFLFRRETLIVANFFVTYYPVLLASKLFGNRYVYFVQDIESKYRSFGGSFLNAVCRMTYRDSHMVAANRHLQRRLATEFSAASECVNVGPAAVFFESPRNAKSSYDVVYFARRETWKGFDRFENILALAAGRISFLCVTQDEQLRHRIDSPQVSFRRPENDVQLIECLDQSRILLFTSYEEGFALPPLEAMARGLPCVLFPCGGPDQYIRNGSNAIYVFSEAEAVDAILKLASDEGSYRLMSEQARQSAQAYELTQALIALAAIIEGQSGGALGLRT